jgi:hypothetical protein
VVKRLSFTIPFSHFGLTTKPPENLPSLPWPIQTPPGLTVAIQKKLSNAAISRGTTKHNTESGANLALSLSMLTLLRQSMKGSIQAKEAEHPGSNAQSMEAPPIAITQPKLRWHSKLPAIPSSAVSPDPR